MNSLYTAQVCPQTFSFTKKNKTLELYKQDLTTQVCKMKQI